MTVRIIDRRFESQNKSSVNRGRFIQRFKGQIRKAVSDAVNKRSIREVDPVMTATILWASWNGIISLAWRHDDLGKESAELTEMLDRATDLVSYGLRLH